MFAFLSGHSTTSVDGAAGGMLASALVAGAIGFTLTLLAGPRLIGILRQRCAEPNTSPSDDIRRLHAAKRSTPTLGGLLIVAATVLALLATTDHRSPYLPGLLVAVVGMAAIGAIDDVVKLRSGRRGLLPRHKLALQFPVALAAALLVQSAHVEPGVWFVPLAALVLVASANAVNLTDGLDGLAGGCFVVAAAALAIAGTATATTGSAEAKVLLSAACGSVLAFLWFNCHPAAVFMGNCGSLALGGVLGAAAIVARQELLLAIVGGVFVAETFSVIVQIVSLRWRRRRVLRCAPLHHHFQLAGWPESKIVVRFWIAGVACAALGLVADFAVRSEVVGRQALTPTLSQGERESTMAARASLARQGRP